MNRSLFNKIINILLFIVLSLQIVIYYYNTQTSTQVLNQENISVENFSSIIFNQSGLTKIGSKKLNKVNENQIFLEGKSYLENKEYKIYGEDIEIKLDKEVSSSQKPVQVINSMGTLNAQGFENIDSENKIYFDGNVIFIIND
tara:strand:- start:1197 stop:1625 length:429 start_codon:yes stop_codon:yes gene_type:complete